ncbi:type II toxin-antitoxin system RelE/ParE family toxin [Methylomonas paludis]|uniref:Type II toxin-antitoxin system RelE/ParE family toxin n=1 Tax=Methylomonas paludis TaxID=1173101 RepID=A0A975MRJ7_9GAMM|nr:type II toxin-antitoxin system RelE/ParE family toxin [Methylomonas paludis]
MYLLCFLYREISGWYKFRSCLKTLTRLDIAKSVNDVNLPGWRLHQLSGNLLGYYSIVVNGNWRIIFKFAGEDVVLVDYLDYH